MLFSNMLPSLLPIWMASIILIVALSCLIKWPFISGAFSGLLLVSFCFYSLFYSHESEIPVQKQFKAEIVSLVSTNSDWISFDIRLISEQNSFYDTNYRLSWQQPPEVKVGQVWLFTARMKPITSPINQGGFNQQKNLLSRHIVAKGRVKQAELVHYDVPLRQSIINKMTPILHSLSHEAVLNALLFGDKSELTQMQWQQLRQTGTGHLVAISGLHLSVVFGLFWFIFRHSLQRFTPVFSRRNLLLAMMFSSLTVLGYGYLAGFAIATQRALVMLLMLVMLSIVNHHSSPWQRLTWALFAVLAIDPFASLSAGFWLSFSALGIILFTLEYTATKTNTENNAVDEANNYGTNNNSNYEHEDLEDELDEKENDEIDEGLKTKEVSADKRLFYQNFKSTYRHYQQQTLLYLQIFWAIQWRLAVGLGLLQAILFGTISINSIWVNLLMVPWFSIVVIPLSIIGLVGNIILMILPLTEGFRQLVGAKLMALGDISLAPFESLISQSDQWPMALVYLPDTMVVCLMMFALGLFLLKWAVDAPWRCVVGLLCVPFFLQLTVSIFESKAPLQQEPFGQQQTWHVHVLDVGQGMAVLVQRGNRAILYDTGAAYGQSFSYADRVIVPTLRAKGINRLDYIIVSHDDNDHSGGLKVLAQHYPKAVIISDTTAHHDAMTANNVNDLHLSSGSDTQKGTKKGTKIGTPKGIQKDTGITTDTTTETVTEITTATDNALNHCVNRRFQWAGLTLSLAANPTATNDNNRSCIAYVDDDKHRVLLTGDIEKSTEQYLVEHKLLSPTDILLAPHHGSRTSSSEAFIDAVSPKQVIFTAGFANQYGFPKKDVVERYKTRGVETLISGNSGQITIDFNSSSYAIRQYRSDIAPFWYNKLFRFGEKVKAE
ncbi:MULTISPECIES: DNA internalization-related competence protein ComEC/Rec2 [unclassified Shewanella]|uniref:DNA internalization-related competence protein ComEC/Rec2 n=1 Tax=unclassified Shewanella TaxID=196818 RepID=UPI00354FDD57